MRELFRLKFLRLPVCLLWSFAAIAHAAAAAGAAGDDRAVDD